MQSVTNDTAAPEATFRPLTQACSAFGIGRTKAFELSDQGLIETFLIGQKRYVVLESLRTLPERLKKAAA
jgi:hypothetical protein